MHPTTSIRRARAATRIRIKENFPKAADQIAPLKDWLKAKAKALEKVSSLNIKIGYPDQPSDFRSAPA